MHICSCRCSSMVYIIPFYFMEMSWYYWNTSVVLVNFFNLGLLRLGPFERQAPRRPGVKQLGVKQLGVKQLGASNWASSNWASSNWASSNWASSNWASSNWASSEQHQKTVSNEWYPMYIRKMSRQKCDTFSLAILRCRDKLHFATNKHTYATIVTSFDVIMLPLSLLLTLKITFQSFHVSWTEEATLPQQHPINILKCFMLMFGTATKKCNKTQKQTGNSHIRNRFPLAKHLVKQLTNITAVTGISKMRADEQKLSLLIASWPKIK